MSASLESSAAFSGLLAAMYDQTKSDFKALMYPPSTGFDPFTSFTYAADFTIDPPGPRPPKPAIHLEDLEVGEAISMLAAFGFPEATLVALVEASICRAPDLVPACGGEVDVFVEDDEPAIRGFRYESDRWSIVLVMDTDTGLADIDAERL
uniref:Uncharacterized protein n=1 Tax=viral metagenome TaxID=1070528 RepID=A0A6M3LL53_9ZZZZ